MKPVPPPPPPDLAEVHLQCLSVTMSFADIPFYPLPCYSGTPFHLLAWDPKGLRTAVQGPRPMAEIPNLLQLPGSHSEEPGDHRGAHQCLNAAFDPLHPVCTPSRGPRA